VIDVHFVAAGVPGCSLGAHMGHTAASTAEAPLAVLCPVLIAERKATEAVQLVL
jgi:hypothetical protein